MANQPTFRDVIVIGGSAGSMQPLLTLVAALPAGLKAAVFIVQHLAESSRHVLGEVIDKASSIPAAMIEEDTSIEPGRIYIAPAGRHMLVKSGVVQLHRGARENRARPAIDPLFRSAARAYGPRVLAVLLSGALNDGTYGAMAVQYHGGVVIAQDPKEALVPEMPQGVVEHILPAASIGPLLTLLTQMPLAASAQVEYSPPPLDAVETAAQPLDEHVPEGVLSPLVCPECGGPLWELHAGRLLQYRCHVGHAFTSEALHVEQSEQIEAALWSALRALQEQAELSRRMAHSAQRAGNDSRSDRHLEDAADVEERARVIRDLLLGGQLFPSQRFGDQQHVSP